MNVSTFLIICFIVGIILAIIIDKVFGPKDNRYLGEYESPRMHLLPEKCPYCLIYFMSTHPLVNCCDHAYKDRI